jgi:peptidoglycan LD-endopeptidase CwlK
MPGIHKSLWLLTEAMQQKVSCFQHQLDINNIPHVIMETLRDQDVQDAYYAQGRQPLEQVNALRATAQLPPITEKDNGSIITHAKVSNHSSGQAIDMPPSRAAYPDSPWWDAPAEVWEKMAVLAESCGLVAGYHWTGFKDSDHFEMPGLS